MLFWAALEPLGAPVGDISSHSWAAAGEAFPWVWCSASQRWWLGRSPGSLTFCRRWCPQGARRFASHSRYPWRWFQKTQTLKETQKQLRHCMFLEFSGLSYGFWMWRRWWGGMWTRPRWKRELDTQCAVRPTGYEYRVVKRDWWCPSYLLLSYWCCQQGWGDLMKRTQEYH